LAVDDIKSVAEIAIKGRWPDLTLILDMPTKKSAQRVQPKFLLDFPEDVQAQLTKDRIELRSFEYHEDVRRKYLDQAKRDPSRYRVINADRAVDAVHQDVLKQLATLK